MGKFLGRGLAVVVGLLVLAFVYLYVLAPHTAYELAQAAERSRAGLTEKQVEAGGFEFHYLEGGSGEPLVLLHGFGADKDNWTRLAARLTDDYRVIAPDLPGFGETDHPGGIDYRVTTQAERVRAFARALELGPVHIGGNSMGGGIAGAYAAAYPDATRSLWLLAPFGVAEAPASELQSQIESGEGNPLLPRTHEDFDRLLDWVFEKRPYIPAPVQYVLAERAIERRPLLADILDQLEVNAFDLADQLAGSPVPTLIVWGRQDRLLHPEGASILAAAIPRSRVQMLDDTGHVPMVERAETVAEAFRTFQRDLPEAAAASAETEPETGTAD